MRIARNSWIVLRNLSLASYVRDAGFDLSIYESYSPAVRRELKKRGIARAIAAIKEEFLNRGIDIRRVKQGIYVISLASPLCVEYEKRQSQVIYVGIGNLMGRIKTHFDRSLFDFMQSLSGANFDFYFAWPARPGCRDYYKHVEWQMLEYFAERYGGLHEDRPYPILNKNAGSRKNIRDRSMWWTKPLKNNGKIPRWALRPTGHSHFAQLT